MTYTFRLPWPPSVNTYWRRNNHVVYVSPQGKKFRTAAVEQIGYGPQLESRLAVALDLIAPTRRKYDVDNCAKAVLDALQHAGVFLDDEQIDQLRITRLHVEPPGCVDVTVTELTLEGMA